ncbi:methionyl-tRNA formyltransferase [Piscinibacter sakaiensis]|uniref:Methionyl-tRNA formyltransferase n=1 Tax=Piscinibacter sakaiensis TaxID=1547922 RepID=A0A0K8P6E0_PISS1|nr:methionyl-tRNA formyltransferase [Piscinibacter sakaiensis]
MFAGTPEFAAVALEALVAAGHHVSLVLTQPDRPSGRGLKPQPSAVKARALAAGLPVAQPRSLRLAGRYPDEAAAARAQLEAARPDAMVVAAYGLILPAWVLALPRLGCLNIHASLLPRWRGAAPIHRAIEAGDTETGITIMQMDEGLDTGPMLLREAVAIAPDDRTGTLHDRLAALGARLLLDALPRWAEGRLPAQAQPPEGVTYAAKVDKAEAVVDWAAPAAVIERRLRAFDPAPGASTTLGGEVLKLWAARVEAGAAPPAAPGTVLSATDDGLRVACGEGVLCLTEVQRAGGRRGPVRALLQARPLAAGDRLGA